MVHLRQASTVTANVFVLTSILLSLFLFPSFKISKIAASNVSTGVNPTNDYGDSLQYEWPQIHGNSDFARFSKGPAPESSGILWKTSISGIQSYVAAFNGKVFVSTMTEIIALDKDTGKIIWRTAVPVPQRWPAVFKIDDGHFVLGRNCLDPETGNVLWVSDQFSANVANFAEGVYSLEEKLFFSHGKSVIQAWNFSDPSKPPALAWETPIPDGGSIGSGIQYGEGKVFPGSYDAHQMALDARTGAVVWDTETTGAMIFSGSYYQGRFLRGGMDNQFYCFNATTGKVLWIFNPGTEFGHWCSGSAVAYGKVYETNKDGNLYAIDIHTGKVVWKYKGPGSLFFPGWPVVADGKVYATTGQAAATDPFTGEHSKSEFACLDAYTGDLLWKLPVEAYAPRESTAIAYGILYLIPGFINENQMDNYVTFNEVWAIGSKSWSMWRSDPEHTGAGQAGPTNLTLRWKFTTNGAVISSPTLVDDKVYVGSNDKNVYCLDALSGKLLWNFTTGFRIKSSPAVVDGRVYIGPDDGYIYCLDANDGSLIWKKNAGGYIPAHFDSVARLSSSPTVIEDRVYVGSLDTNLYCLNASFGNIIWTHKTAGYITSSPAVVDNAVYFTSQEPATGVLYKLEANTSRLIWKLELPYQLTAERGTDMHASPVVADGMVFASANKFEYYGINATTGRIEWTYRNLADEFIVNSVAYNSGKIYFVDQFFIVCADAKNGNPLWKSWLREVLESSPTYADGKIYVAASDQRVIFVLNATTGERLSWFKTSSKSWSSPTIYKGMLYIGNHDWNVYCLVDASYPVIPTSITAKLSKSAINLAAAQSVTVSGQINPRIANARVTVAFANPTGATLNFTSTTDEEGNFSISYTPDAIGNWTITARYSGEECPSRTYTPANSTVISLEVIGAPSPEQTSVTGVPTEYVLTGTIVTIAIVATLAYTYLKRHRGSRIRTSVQGSKTS